MTVPGEGNPSDAIRPSLLDGAFSIEYPDCSIAAADLCREASDLLSDVATRKDAYITGADDLHTLAWRKLGPKLDGPTFTLNGYNAELVLVQTTMMEATTGHDLEQIQRRRNLAEWVLRKEVAKSATPRQALEEMRTGDPLLAVHFGDTLLPIASFARREKEGICSYVQLGLE